MILSRGEDYAFRDTVGASRVGATLVVVPREMDRDSRIVPPRRRKSLHC